MSARGMIALLLAVIVLAALLLVSSTDIVLKERTVTVHSISALIPDEHDDCWVNFKRGMDSAAIDYNADVSFITLYERARADQQSELLVREIENGAQALIICPADSEIIAATLEEKKVALPVIAVNSEIEGSQVKAFIGANRRAMGEKLAFAIRQDSRSAGITGVVAVSVPGKRHDIDETLGGLSAGLAGSGLRLRREYALYDEDAVAILESFNPEQGEVIVALDAASMQMLAAHIRELPVRRQALYGAGCTNSIIRGLEDGAIRAVAVANDYDAGYLSVKTAVELLERIGGGEYTPGHVLIRPEDIYDKRHEMLLFPIP